MRHTWVRGPATHWRSSPFPGDYGHREDALSIPPAWCPGEVHHGNAVRRVAVPVERVHYDALGPRQLEDPVNRIGPHRDVGIDASVLDDFAVYPCIPWSEGLKRPRVR